MKKIQIEMCKDPRVRLFRNNVGDGWVGKLVNREPSDVGLRVVLDHARPISFGLTPGSGDLIGGVSLLVTPDMIGRRVFVFASPEVKTRTGRATAQQETFIHVVNHLGGLADIVRSVEDARRVLTLDRP